MLFTKSSHPLRPAAYTRVRLPLARSRSGCRLGELKAYRLCSATKKQRCSARPKVDFHLYALLVNDLPVSLLQEPHRAGVLSEDDLRDLSSYRCSRAYRSALASKLLLRGSLARHQGVPAASLTFCRGRNGKPYLSQRDRQIVPSIQFSVSRSGELAICGIAKHAIGVDVEVTDQSLDPHLERTVLADCERLKLERLVSSPDRRRDLLQYWTLKEALLKATGVGLSREPSTIAFSALGSSPRISESAEEVGSSWRFSSYLVFQKYLFSVALRT